MDYYTNEDIKRDVRRRRRKNAQMKAYIALAVILIALIGGGIYGGIKISNTIKKNKPEKEVAVVESVVETTEEETTTVEETTVMETTTEEETTLSPEEEAELLLNELVDSCVSEMTLEEKVAGLFIVTPESLTGVATAIKAGEGTKEALEKYPVGGMIYFEKNIRSKDQITEMITATKDMNAFPMFFAVDEEGGKVARVQSGLRMKKTPTMAELASENNPAKVTEVYDNIGTYLSEYGFNLNFAPVADVLTNEENTAIGQRAFGSDPALVSTMVSTAVTSLEGKNVSACLKHFPGQGAVSADTHTGMASTDRTLEEMKEVEFKPFMAGIEAGAQMIMVSHISAPNVTGDNTPASLSKIMITEILREELGFDGVVITDALNMAAISDYYTTGDACILALKAGADMLLMPEDFEEAYEAVVNAVQNGTVSEERINDSLKRVYKIKYKSTLDK